MRKWLPIALALLVAVLVAACGGETKPSFKLTDITGARFGQDFHLTDFNGRARSLADFKGKAVVLFFGYTHCPDVCPTTMAELAQVMQQLGADAKRVQVLFVTVDPARDTPQVLKQYVPAFNPSFIGLYGDAAATAAVAKEFHVVYQKQPDGGSGNYSVDHSAGTYIFDPQGRLRLFAGYGVPATDYVHDLKLLLADQSD
ncbi:MAG TPA: SCO family protein [Burkholderiales bacterium]|jgi:protein SCO1/2|nr:SCO family protein [Burkholderiales bacterium]